MMSYLGVSVCAGTFQSHIQHSTCSPETCLKPGHLYSHLYHVSYLKHLLAARTFQYSLPHPIFRVSASLPTSHLHLFFLLTQLFPSATLPNTKSLTLTNHYSTLTKLLTLITEPNLCSIPGRDTKFPSLGTSSVQSLVET